MSQPEIFHRCPHCGASSKPGELFCAQCGNALARENQPAQQDIAASESAGPFALSDTTGAEATERAATPSPSLQSSEHATINDPEPGTITPSVTSAVVAPPRQNPATAGRSAALAARGGMEDRVRPRADKLRRVSSVVLNEAASDSGVRFILVVGILFVLFLVLLFLSKWIV